MRVVRLALLGLILGGLLLAEPARAQRLYFGFGSGGYGYGRYGYGPSLRFGYSFGYPYRGYRPYGYYPYNWPYDYYGTRYGYYRRPYAFRYDGPLYVYPREVPRYRYDDLSRYQPSIPTAAQCANMSWSELGAVLRDGAALLDAQVTRFGDKGAGWKKYLHVESVRNNAAEADDAPPDAKAVNELTKALKAYDHAATQQKFAKIAALAGFRTVHVALNEYLSPIEPRLRRLLGHEARRLNAALGSLGDRGAGWQRYLKVPDGVLIEDEPGSPEATEPDVDALDNALARFDAVRNKAEYHTIFSLPEFQTTHRLLADYVAHVSQTSDDDRPKEPASNEEKQAPPPTR